MTCRDVMTGNPSCSLPHDSVETVAQLMKREDIGPVLVVNDHNERRLVGIVTDRDLTLKVVAEGRDPRSTRVDEVMTRNPVSCHEDDDSSVAINMMGRNQIRRVPVTDHEGRLVGIIAQADLARSHDEQQVGEMVEEISQPYGSGIWSGITASGRSSDRSDVGAQNTLLAGAVCFGIGAGLMYLLDPSRGRTRRTRVRDKAIGAYSASSEVISRTGRDIRNRAAGVAASTRSMLHHEPVSDEKLVARVRSKMGRYVSHPGAVEVSAQNGTITLRGAILSNEASGFVKCVAAIPGVNSVTNQLEMHEEPGNHPGLQGGRTRRGEQWEFMQSNWTPATRLMASALGGGLLVYGMKNQGKLAKATATVGLGLLTRGVTNREMTEWTNLAGARRLVGL